MGEADYSEGDTSYIAVVDKDHNMVSFEPSLHSGFGTGVVMADLGFIFNCRGDYYSLTPGEPRSLEPGKRPRSTLQSTLVIKDGRPWLITGSPGGDDQIQRTVQTLMNMIDFGMNVQKAIEAPRWSTRGFASSAMSTSTTSKRKRMSGLSSIRSHARAPREIRFRFSRSTAANGRPKSSRVRVFTSINTSVSLSRHTTSISPPLRPRKLRKRIL